MNTKAMLRRAGCQLRVVCQQRWDDFNEVGESKIRFCKLCQKLVFYTTTPEQLKSLAAAGQCAFIVPGSYVLEEDNQYQESLAEINRRGIDTKSFLEPSVGMPILSNS